MILPHHLRVCAGLDCVQVNSIPVAVLAAHEQDDLDTVASTNLLDGRCKPFALGGARGAVVEVTVHVGNTVIDGHPHLLQWRRS